MYVLIYHKCLIQYFIIDILYHTDYRVLHLLFRI